MKFRAVFNRMHRLFFSSSFHSDNIEENKLLNQLRIRIEATGPLSVADYMKEVLLSPSSGYYMKKDVFGSHGDFITSPEISQVFGELIGIWFYNEWLKVGKPQPLQLVEFGPGRGTLTDDLLRVFSKFMPHGTQLSIHFIEVSPHLRKLQALKLCSTDTEEGIENDLLPTKYGFPLKWHSSLESVPENFSLFLAHEFFDALPIHKFQKTTDGWKEILVDYRGGQLQFVLSRSPTPASKLLIDPNENRDHVEISPETGVILDQVLKRMKEDGGISLIVDYGHQGTKTDTFRSFQGHKLHDPLEKPGEADLTADVDFSFIKKCAKNKAVIFGPVNQADFLKNMGIDVRLEKLMESATPEDQKSLKSGYKMLMSPDEMGERFKFLALYPVVLKDRLRKYPPAGF
ncbi:protein arginine methyltransferase NDUFAF7, mitochondrial-like isoform X2 [Uloborus diversus]|uniref:protein arginine methyltransferase NDUFAF7, mitochondrial-like isoform X2 n=1 Tax=Uloborus diversus TaxID=327109 RepID=UPI00240A1008|nr:protein arginine methyltransferase NDUFAF7, mitochondrial-like isoform X2 [Uloborus diversus]